MFNKIKKHLSHRIEEENRTDLTKNSSHLLSKKRITTSSYFNNNQNQNFNIIKDTNTLIDSIQLQQDDNKSFEKTFVLIY